MKHMHNIMVVYFLLLLQLFFRQICGRETNIKFDRNTASVSML